MNTAPNEVRDISHDSALVMSGATHTSFLNPEYAESHDRRILVVDDEECVRQLFTSYLGETYFCAAAADAQEALELLAREALPWSLQTYKCPG